MKKHLFVVPPRNLAEVQTASGLADPLPDGQRTSQAEDHTRIQSRSLRLLIADNHELMRQGVALVLEREAGVSVVAQAHDGHDVLSLAHEHRPNIVIIELAMPDMSGEEITRSLRATSPFEPRVIVLTHKTSVSFLEPMLRAGAKGYVLKRADPRELVRAVRVVANGGTYVDPNLSEAFDSRFGRLRRESRGLTRRESSVLILLAWGYSNAAVADRLKISTKTVEFYRACALEKLNVKGRTGIVRHAVREGWLTEDNMPPT